ncbi:hypothetical protein [Rhodococcoides fascians]|uniref:hypothetical protein n=1 Tax=Rhodococcoides fascians TaxID=1828 RepID=UPI00055EA15F|nr:MULTISPECIES: hypothetical protein [Rhodococcus]OZF05555.1 hypothetical protein CH301_03980 [Rhodococcus sp. 15-1189-1-1a]OZF20339.1 hypothetical protein CH299_04525 [Rhodococcus sp. 14-2686-1-2]
MEKDIATLLDAAAFQAADMVGPAIVLEGAGRHLLDRLDLNDPHRFAVISAVGSITAARKSLESAAEELLAVVAQDGADMLAVEVNNGEIKQQVEVRVTSQSYRCESQRVYANGDVVRCDGVRGHGASMHGDAALGLSWRSDDEGVRN